MYYCTVFVGQESEDSLAGSSAQSFTRLQSAYWQRLGSHLRLKVLFQTHVVVDRIDFLAAVELVAASSRQAGEKV